MEIKRLVGEKYVLVKVDKPDAFTTTESGIISAVDTVASNCRPADRGVARETGTVIMVPKAFYIQEEVPFAPPGAEVLTETKRGYICKIKIHWGLEPGDRILFSIREVDFAREAGHSFEGDLFLISCHSVYYKILPDGGIQAVGPYLICEPIPADPGEVRTVSGILTSVEPKENIRSAIVRSMGDDYTGCIKNRQLKEGDVVYHNLRKPIPVHVGDQDWIRLGWRNVMAVNTNPPSEDEIARRREVNAQIRNMAQEIQASKNTGHL